MYINHIERTERVFFSNLLSLLDLLEMVQGVQHLFLQSGASDEMDQDIFSVPPTIQLICYIV